MAEQGHQGRFYYEGSEVAGKIEQQLADSKTFDEAPREAAFDLVFVDGGHTRSYVENDSRKALRMVKPGGFIIWHDYLGRRVKDVFEVLNELSREVDLVHLANTSFVAYRAPPRE
jgi:predicted O-methyltransferase YrrM